MGTLLDLFDTMEREKTEKCSLSSINITTTKEYSLFREEGKNILVLDGQRYEIADGSTLFVRGDKVYVNNQEVHPSFEEDADKVEGNSAIEHIRKYYLPREINLEGRLLLKSKRKAAEDDRLDKRIPLSIYHFVDPEGHLFPVRVYRCSKERKRYGTIHYGTMELFAHETDTDEDIAHEVQYLIDHVNLVYFLPYYDEGEELFFFGHRQKVTTDSTKEGNPDFFVIPKGEHPIKKYKELFFLYLKKRIVEVGDEMGMDLRRWEIRVGTYQSFYACNCYAKRYFCFDYRNAAFATSIVDSLIVHEVSHCYIHNHSKAFYRLCEKYFPNYHYFDFLLDRGILNIKYLNEEEKTRYASEN